MAEKATITEHDDAEARRRALGRTVTLDAIERVRRARVFYEEVESLALDPRGIHSWTYQPWEAVSDAEDGLIRSILTWVCEYDPSSMYERMRWAPAGVVAGDRIFLVAPDHNFDHLAEGEAASDRIAASQKIMFLHELPLARLVDLDAIDGEADLARIRGNVPPEPPSPEPVDEADRRLLSGLIVCQREIQKTLEGYGQQFDGATEEEAEGLSLLSRRSIAGREDNGREIMRLIRREARVDPAMRETDPHYPAAAAVAKDGSIYVAFREAIDEADRLITIRPEHVVRLD